MSTGLAVLAVLCACVASACSTNPTDVPLNTTKGPIVGLRFNPNSATGVSYDAFLGVPYGKPPGRFEVAVPPESWSQPLRTQADGAMCPQPGAVYSEDCLFLNVFTPMNAAAKPGTLPVIAFIHGSAFTLTSSSSKVYGPDFLITQNVILVTMNYRLGAAGFLTLGSSIAPGNMGLTDTLLALQWIQKEITAFGGDPSQVTLQGQSAGSVMTQLHYISPLSVDLFARAIAQSGSAVAQWGLLTVEEGSRRSRVLAEAVGCNNTTNDTEVFRCLQQADISDIVGNQSIALSLEDTIAGSNGMRFVPVLDSYLTADMPFFNDTLENLMEQALTRGKPLLTGITTDDGIVKFYIDDSWRHAQKNLATFLPRIAYQTASDAFKAFLQDVEIAFQYFPYTVDENKVEDLVRLYTDTMFAYPSVQVTRYFANITYSYLFNYYGSWRSGPVSQFPYRLEVVKHGDDLHYLFYMANEPQNLDTCGPNLPNLAMRDNMVQWWTNFAKTGKPGPSWQTVQDGGYLVIDSQNSTMNVSEFESKYYDFWANIEKSSSYTTTTAASVVVLFIALCNLIL